MATQVDLGLNGALVSELEHPGDRRDRVEVDLAADGCSKRSSVEAQPGSTDDVGRSELIGQSLCGPDTKVDRSPSRVLPWHDSPQQQPRPQHRESHPAQRGDQQQPTQADHPPGCGGQPADPQPASREVVDSGNPGGPAQAGHRPQRDRQGQLPELGGARQGTDWPVPRCDRWRHRVQRGGKGAQGGLLVDVGDRDVGEPLAQAGHQVCGGQAAARYLEEVVRGIGDDGTEDVKPQLLEPPRRALQLDRQRGPRAQHGERPRQGISVDLARDAGGQ